MASAIRRASADLDGDALSRFRSAPWRFDVWQAGAILEAWKGRMDWGVPASDIIPAGVVRGVAFPEGGAPRLDVNLLGLAGMDGPLPPHVALLVRERMRAGDPAFQEFLDLFHNRILHLWRDMASSLCPELRADGLPEDHPFAAFLEAVSGLPNTGERARDVPMPGPVDGRGEARVEPFHGAWVDLPEEDLTRLGGRDAGNARLGSTALLGSRVFDASAGIILRLGPLTEAQRRMFLPPPAGTCRADLLALVRWYLGDVGCEIVLERQGGTGRKYGC